MNDSIETKVVAQIVGYKNLKIAGGMRVEIDLFEARESDILKMVLLANRKEVVTMTLEPYREEDEKKVNDKWGSTKEDAIKAAKLPEFKDGEV